MIMISETNKILEQLKNARDEQGDLAAVELLIQNPTWVHARYVQDFVGPLLLRLVSLQLNNLHSEDLPKAFEKLVTLLSPLYVFTAEDADLQDLEELHREIDLAGVDLRPCILMNFPIDIKVLGGNSSIQIHQIGPSEPIPPVEELVEALKIRPEGPSSSSDQAD